MPSMDAIRAIPWNGYRVVSTFSGAGGSSLGYKMAGFRVVWASEFIAAARETYAANFPDTILDGRDIRAVMPEDMLEAAHLRVGELDLLDGSPPCASFSTAGKRQKGWGKVRTYSEGAQRSDDLFFEYIRILRGIQPKMFVAENVSGLVTGVSKGYFKEILAAFRDSGYRVRASVLDAQWLGVPQARKRLIFIGVRTDLAPEPVHPMPLPYNYSVREVMPWIIGQARSASGPRSSILSEPKGWANGEFVPAAYPSPTIGASPHSGNGRCPPSMVQVRDDSYRVIHDTSGQFSVGDITDKPACTVTTAPHFMVEKRAGDSGEVTRRKLTIAELKRICGFPDDFLLTGSFAQQWERLGRAVPPVMMSHIAATARDAILAKC